MLMTLLRAGEESHEIMLSLDSVRRIVRMSFSKLKVQDDDDDDEG